ncbi:sensor protein CutS [Streptomyces lasiicapitis]|uniref:histidine kinase n=2 Tax=Streptomyces lasiicapitis TaxID=1923961 RepID=A0ABQ2M2B2_9ACTN|nr:sensor protein CutS [Streptomyces lasiicapitis]
MAPVPPRSPHAMPPAPPRRLHSARNRLAFLYSTVVFGLAAVLVTALYFICGAALTRRSLSDEVARTGGVVTGGHFARVDADPASLVPFEAAANRATLSTLRELLAWSLLGLFLVSVFVGRLIAGRVLAPVDRLISTTRQIQATDLTRRIRHKGADDELKRLADTIDDMLDRLNDAFTSQQRFVADASHELRTPLAIVRTNLDVAVRALPAASPAHRPLQRVDRATQRMTALVNDLLALARWESQHQCPQPVDVAALNRQIREESRALAPPDIGITGTGDGGRALTVLGDPLALQRAIGNLVDNALRHARPGTAVRLTGTLADEQVHVTVHNEGPAIPPEDQQHLFDRFWRWERRADRPGSGLGLAIVQGVVTAHGGTVTVRSEPGYGTAFTITLPHAGPPPGQPPGRPRAERYGSPAAQ